VVATEDRDEEETKGVFALIEEEESKQAQAPKGDAPLSKKQKKAAKDAVRAAE
jgi:hypothetical protein